jgi:hypothetical protein
MHTEIQLHGHPPLRETVPLALAAAQLARDAQPSGRLLDWFGERRTAPLQWTAADTQRLLEVLRAESARSVRFLDVTGVLERAVPDLAAALERRRADPGELDPVGVLRFPTVTRLGELLDRPATCGPDDGWPTDELLLAALVIDVVGPDHDRAAAASLLHQLAVPQPEPIEHLLSAVYLLRAASADADGYDPAEIRQLASHIAAPSVAEAAHLLAVALEPIGWHRRGLDELHVLIIDLLRHPEWLGEQADSIAEAHRLAAEALSHEPGTLQRLRSTPLHHLLAHAGQFGAQLVGAVVIWTVIFGVAFAFFKIQDAVSKATGKGGIRSKEDSEQAGLDTPELGVLAYSEFNGSHASVRELVDVWFRRHRGSMTRRRQIRPPLRNALSPERWA